MNIENHTPNGNTARNNAHHPLTAHRWEDGHEYIVYLEPDARGIYCEVAAIPVKNKPLPIGQKPAIAGTA